MTEKTVADDVLNRVGKREISQGDATVLLEAIKLIVRDYRSSFKRFDSDDERAEFLESIVAGIDGGK